MTQTIIEHSPVMSKEVVDWLNPQPDGKYLDGTLGTGGHTLALLEKAKGRIQVVGLDRDESSLEFAARRMEEAGYLQQAKILHYAFSDFPQALQGLGWNKLDGAVLDLGISSFQLEDSERGFSFHIDGPLDMRMDMNAQEPASILVNRASFDVLKQIIKEYGEDPMAGRIARKIVESRVKKPITSTWQLAEIVKQAYPAKWRHKSRNHPATRTFQAIRIAVNSELEELQEFLKIIPKYLRPGARLAVIAFHSLEDRQVKHFFKRESRDCICPADQPVCMCEHKATLKILTKKPLTPGREEMQENIRSRSAKLRVAEAL